MNTVTARQCAEKWGISPVRARRILAPIAPTGRDITTGAMLYDESAAQAARDAMPGQGTRTDLSQPGGPSSAPAAGLSADGPPTGE